MGDGGGCCSATAAGRAPHAPASRSTIHAGKLQMHRDTNAAVTCWAPALLRERPSPTEPVPAPDDRDSQGKWSRYFDFFEGWDSLVF